jgi:phage shock protein A
MNTNTNFNEADLKAIERLILRYSDDVAISIARSFERMEERIDAMESRTYARLAEVEDRIEAVRRDLSEQLEAKF